LRDLLRSSHAKDLDSDVIDDIEEAIQSLILVLQRPKSFIIKTLNSDHGVLKDRNIANPNELSRNINSFKMKGMSSIGGEIQDIEGGKVFFE
jgi:hypothetical protein